jgi:hypothetical protein
MCTPANLFSFAQWLCDTKPQNPSACLINTIVNRAYYAALICVRDTTGAKTTGSGGHINVVNALRLQNQSAANKLNSLRIKRCKADYTNNTLSVRDAVISVSESREVLFSMNCRLDVGKTYSDDFLDSSCFLSAAL